ncbi:Beclin family [Macleaya cordata]|uniref:Beclin family n=1 Tax=Macleaya cordata TaxID=56857 RepID=A0A200Q5F4_MACCD|nr:Beclin family [Macleaya cordata]
MKGDMSDKGRSFPVDLNIPRWVCQNCRNSLCIVGVDSYAEKFLNESSSRADHSFVVLPKQKSPAQGIPPRPRGGPTHSDTSTSGKAMEDSFVVLPLAVASMYKCESASDGGTYLPSSGGSPSGPLQPNNSGFHSSITVLKRAFDIATTQTKVEQPLCLECMRVLSDKLDKEVEDVNKDIKAYEACLQRLEGETRDVISEADFLREKLKIEEEERRLEAAIEETEKQCVEVNAELKELELKSKRFKDMEERYWHEFNNFQFQFSNLQEERDAILAKIEVSQAHLEFLKRTNVLNDAFTIWHDGEFGTINNFRLGRLPKIHVEWDEINAAWGQACLLLHTMAQYFRPKFPYPFNETTSLSIDCLFNVIVFNARVELFNLVDIPSKKKCCLILKFIKCQIDPSFVTNLIVHSAYKENHKRGNCVNSKKMTLYLIENDRVENYTITQSFNKQENWTKALKYTLCNLKWALYWFVGNTNFQPLSAMVSSPAEVPAHHYGTDGLAELVRAVQYVKVSPLS